MLGYSFVSWVLIDMDCRTASEGNGGLWIEGLTGLGITYRPPRGRIFDGKHIVFWLLNDWVLGIRKLLSFVMGDAMHVMRHIIVKVPLSMG